MKGQQIGRYHLSNQFNHPPIVTLYDDEPIA
jgi:hypothetical protein